MLGYVETFICRERRGTNFRTVVEVEPTRTVEVYLSVHLKPPIPTPFKDLSKIYSPGARIFLVDRVGMMAKGPLEFEGMPDVHVGFWDRVLVGREQMCYTVARMVASDMGAKGVWTAIPKLSRATLAFAKRVGFRTYRETSDSEVLVLLIT